LTLFNKIDKIKKINKMQRKRKNKVILFVESWYMLKANNKIFVGSFGA